MASSYPPLKDDKAALPEHVRTPTRDSHDIVTVQGGDLLDLESVDPVLNAKVKLVNDTIDEIGFTAYQAKLFVLNGFGYVMHLSCSLCAQCGRGAGDSKTASHVDAGHWPAAVTRPLATAETDARKQPCSNSPDFHRTPH